MDDNAGPVEIPTPGRKGQKVVPIPGPVLELMQGEIERSIVATTRFEKKLRAVAILSGVPEGVPAELKTNPDGSAFFVVGLKDGE